MGAAIGGQQPAPEAPFEHGGVDGQTLSSPLAIHEIVDVHRYNTTHIIHHTTLTTHATF